MSPCDIKREAHSITSALVHEAEAEVADQEAAAKANEAPTTTAATSAVKKEEGDEEAGEAVGPISQSVKEAGGMVESGGFGTVGASSSAARARTPAVTRRVDNCSFDGGRAISGSERNRVQGTQPQQGAADSAMLGRDWQGAGADAIREHGGERDGTIVLIFFAVVLADFCAFLCCYYPLGCQRRISERPIRSRDLQKTIAHSWSLFSLLVNEHASLSLQNGRNGQSTMST